MLAEFLALQLLTSAIGTKKNEVLCYVHGINQPVEISASIDENGVGYVNKEINNYTFQAVVAKSKINTLRISNANNDDEQNVDMLNASQAMLSYTDKKADTKLEFVCSIQSPEAEHQVAKNDVVGDKKF